MVTYTKYKSGVVKTTYPTKIEYDGQVMNVDPLTTQQNQTVSDSVRLFGFLLPTNQRVECTQFATMIQSYTDDFKSHILSNQVRRLDELSCQPVSG